MKTKIIRTYKTSEIRDIDIKKENKHSLNYSSLEEQISKLESKLAIYESKVKEISKLDSIHKEQKNLLANQCNYLEKQNALLKNEIKEIKKNSTKNEGLENKLNNQKKYNKRLERTNKRYKDRHSDLNSQYQDLLKQYKALLNQENLNSQEHDFNFEVKCTEYSKIELDYKPLFKQQAKDRKNNIKQIVDLIQAKKEYIIEKKRNITKFTNLIQVRQEYIKKLKNDNNKEVKNKDTQITLSIYDILSKRRITEYELETCIKKAKKDPKILKALKENQIILNGEIHYTKELWDTIISGKRKKIKQEKKLSSGFKKNEIYSLEDALKIITNDIKFKDISEHIKNNKIKYEIYQEDMPGLCWHQILYDMKKNIRIRNILSKPEISEKDYFVLNHEAPLTLKQELHLGKIIKEELPNKDEAINTLVKCNLKFAAYQARKYTHLGLAEEELYQEAGIGLLKAARKFNYEKGKNFITYANWWIKQRVTRAITQTSRTIRVPDNIVAKYIKLKKEIKTITDKNGVEPDFDEICDYLNYSETDKIGIKEIIKGITSLDKENNDGMRFGDVIEDRKTQSPDESADYNAKKDRINDTLKNLNKQEQYVITKRFGLEDNHPMTLEEIGITMTQKHESGLSRERVRQIESKALKKLQKKCNSNKLIDFYESD